MPYTLFKLSFSTGLHIGADSGGPSPEDTQLTIHADTLFSALFHEAVRSGEDDHLLNSVRDGGLMFSDALPYGIRDLYLPKPILSVEHPATSLDPSEGKAYRRLKYLPLSSFKEYLEGLSGSPVPSAKVKEDFGLTEIRVRAGIHGFDETMPYRIAVFRFQQGCGLYIIIKYTGDAERVLFYRLLADLGLTGIGGMHSSGFGKFSVVNGEVPAPLSEWLAGEDMAFQMLLGTGLPYENELEVTLDGGWYSLVRRGGYVYSSSYSLQPLKKRTTYLLAPGSCLKKRFDGPVMDVSEHGAHPVWRCAKTLFMGVDPCV